MLVTQDDVHLHLVLLVTQAVEKMVSRLKDNMNETKLTNQEEDISQNLQSELDGSGTVEAASQTTAAASGRACKPLSRPRGERKTRARKSWHESRNYCLERGADLMIINNQKEQDFTRRFVGYTWIGLKRTENKEEWRWVDGTPLTKSYWIPGEPNNNGGKEDCVHLKFHGREKSWNDISCDVKNFWICEKMVVC
ncbi:CD209 antigen-like protein E isoform X3 [Cheilinus undulatus]|uniref:CD209 antigen-like protein E isoform X3 n=1 Tax=Cheilinus undulatus TaxID=241271 RepID=UPI001BD33C9D|nr:CD209 antigen-like protein E isoform X3 [Cheilinus undulatus]